MEIIAADINGNEHIFENFSVTINSDYTTPADEAVVVMPYEKSMPEIKEIRIEADGEIIFYGVADVIKTSFSRQGGYVQIEARNLAGVLLDNESRPTVYNGASAGIIFENHIRPYGVKAFYGRDIMLAGSFSVTKGMNEWQTVREFCKSCYGTFPYFAPNGTVYFEPEQSDTKAVFSNSGGIAYTSLCDKKSRCNLISRVYIKTENSGGYKSYIDSNTAALAGVTSVRYLDASEDNITPACAEDILALAEREYRCVELICPARVTLRPGTPARIEDSTLGVIENLFVAKTKYTLSGGGEKTVVLLKGGA